MTSAGSRLPGDYNPRRRSDYGLFGPDSVTWKIMGEPVMWIAGMRALYLQALHPRVMKGTWQNTSFARPDEAWGRFTRTIKFVQVRTYGTAAEAERAGRRIRKIHAALSGTDADGTLFRLDEPELLLWVHCAEIASEADIALRGGVPVTAAELDAFVDEQRRSAALVGLDPTSVPGSMAELDAYFARTWPALYACAEAKQALRQSFTPKVPLLFLPLRLIAPPVNLLAFGSLPSWARRLYGVPTLPFSDAAVTLALRAAYESSARVPPQLLFVPGAAVARRIRRAVA